MQKTSDQRVYLENQATDARLRLEGRLRELFERRRYWTAAARRVAHPPTTALLIAALGLTAIVLVAQRGSRRRGRALRRARLLALLRPQPTSGKGFLRQTLEKTARSLLADAGRQLGRRGVEHLLHRPASLAEGRTRAGDAQR